MKVVLRKVGCVVMVYLAGGVSAINITHMKYGIPEHYESGGWKIVFSLLLAVMFGVFAIGRNRD